VARRKRGWSWRQDDNGKLATDLGAWFRAVTDHSGPLRPGALCLRRVKDLRDATTRLLDTHMDGYAGAPSDVTVVHDAWQAALAIADVPPLLAAHLALAVADLLYRPDLSMLRRCDGDGCG
jgi:predicted RNA-binding Zn ribbon-like protein